MFRVRCVDFIAATLSGWLPSAENGAHVFDMHIATIDVLDGTCEMMIICCCKSISYIYVAAID